MRLEPEVWDALREVCLREGIELRDLIRTVERTATPGGRTSAVRVYVLDYFRKAATEDGHERAGHGNSTATGPISVLNDLPNEIQAVVPMQARLSEMQSEIQAPLAAQIEA